MSLLELPNTFLLRALSRISLNELISFRAVCSKFLSLVDQICTKKRELKLFFGCYIPDTNRVFFEQFLFNYSLNKDRHFASWWHAKDNVLILPELIEHRVYRSNNFATGISTRFPSVIKLVVVRLTESVIMQLHNLLRHWHRQLTDLTVVQNNHKCNRHAFSILWRAINRISSLRALHLYNLDKALQPKLMSPFSSLEEITLDGFISTNLYLALRRVGINLENLRLGCPPKRFTESSPKLDLSTFPTITHFSLNMGVVGAHFIASVPLVFPNLTYLDISFTIHFKVPLGPLLRWLKELMKLQVLKIDVTAFDYDQRTHQQVIRLGDKQSKYCEDTRNSFAQLNQVRSLHLYDWCDVLHHFGYFYLLPFVFNSLTQLNVLSTERVQYDLNRQFEIYFDLSKVHLQHTPLHTTQRHSCRL